MQGGRGVQAGNFVTEVCRNGTEQPSRCFHKSEMGGDCEDISASLDEEQSLADQTLSELKCVRQICDEFSEMQNRSFKKFLMELRNASEIQKGSCEEMVGALRKIRINQKKLAKKSLSKEISLSE
jgi:hypothetical protein